uniref:Uncharacterized protein n=1 Tax=Triatoma infestans TaxID=30076 RepID=A0A023FAF3_TRIIF
MVYETDFYTIRRPYSRPTITSYSVTRRSVPWEKVPTVSRPSQIPEPFTVYGTRCNYYPADRHPPTASRPHTRILYDRLYC